MTETIKLMKAHTSVRRFKEQEIPQADLEEILTAGQMASSWKNFQSYSVILVRSQEKKDALYELVPQEAIRQSAALLLFVGDLNRAETHGQFPTSRGRRSPYHVCRRGACGAKYLACSRESGIWWCYHRFSPLQVRRSGSAF
ncbi:NADPH-flavin oxidoreductase-like protein [Streptococcus oralis subsp. tigurinus AZ_3a]|nr:NADPH-flavin oxidoreductase-like protein [Streptococcus oralis subsp. tigurinus AZ_3a]